MTHTQWLFEYESLLERDLKESEHTLDLMKTFRYVLIKLMGLDLLSDNAQSDANNINYVPLALLVSHPKVTQELLKKIQQTAATESAINDSDFEQLSAAIATGSIGDMDPIIAGPDSAALLAVERANRLKQLTSAGVKLVQPTDKSQVTHLNINHDKLTEKIASATLKKQQLLDEVKQLLKEDADRINQPNVKMTFDDNG